MTAADAQTGSDQWGMHLCGCGCGSPTPIATTSRARNGQVKGQPMPRLKGHRSSPPIEERFWSRVDITPTCWLWMGARKGSGYGQMQERGRRIQVHRYAYELLVGPIPDGLYIDHLCRVRNCVNPEHLEPVTNGENVRRGMAPSMVTARTGVCRRGHVNEYVTRPNGDRVCLPCRRAWLSQRAAS